MPREYLISLSLMTCISARLGDGTVFARLSQGMAWEQALHVIFRGGGGGISVDVARFRSCDLISVPELGPATSCYKQLDLAARGAGLLGC